MNDFQFIIITVLCIRNILIAILISSCRIHLDLVMQNM